MLVVRQPYPSSLAGYMVLSPDEATILAGVGHTFRRAWVFPLQTPTGMNVLQECPFDHPFHNGIFTAQAHVVFRGRDISFWAHEPDPRDPDNPIYANIGSVRTAPPMVAVEDEQARFTFESDWCGPDGAIVLYEHRQVQIRMGRDAVFCDVLSLKTAASDTVDFLPTKHGSIGLRVQPQLAPVYGGRMRAVVADTVQNASESFVAEGATISGIGFESSLPGRDDFGVCILPVSDTFSADCCGPWFARDYGLAMFNPTFRSARRLHKGECWQSLVRFVAYDRSMTSERVRLWRSGTIRN